MGNASEQIPRYLLLAFLYIQYNVGLRGKSKNVYYPICIVPYDTVKRKYVKNLNI